jgi:hypothetical protein
MPYNPLSFLRRTIRGEAVGEITALFGTTLLLLLMMTPPDWEEPTYQIVWGVTGLGLVAFGSYLILRRRRDPRQQRGRGARE